MAFRSRNDLRVRGTIVFIRSGETGAGVPFVNIRIVTDSGPRKDYPMFRFYGESAAIAAKFERGNRVLVTGHASLRRKLDENRQPTNGYQQLLIGDSIEMSKRELSRYLNLTSDHMSEYDGGHMRDENGAFVTGEVVHTYEIYKARYEIIKHQREVAKKDRIPSFEKYTLKPNSMQEEFIVNLRKIMEKGGRADKQGNKYEKDCIIYEMIKVLNER